MPEVFFALSNPVTDVSSFLSLVKDDFVFFDTPVLKHHIRRFLSENRADTFGLYTYPNYSNFRYTNAFKCLLDYIEKTFYEDNVTAKILVYHPCLALLYPMIAEDFSFANAIKFENFPILKKDKIARVMHDSDMKRCITFYSDCIDATGLPVKTIDYNHLELSVDELLNRRSVLDMYRMLNDKVILENKIRSPRPKISNSLCFGRLNKETKFSIICNNLIDKQSQRVIATNIDDVNIKLLEKVI